MKASSLALAISVLGALAGRVEANDNEEGWQKQQPPGTEQQLAWRSRIRSTLYVPDPLPPLDAETHGQFEPAPRVVAERVTYGTQFGMRVPAILYLPQNRAENVAALVVVNGHRPFFVTKRVALWLEEQLDFPNWTEADIRDMGTTRIGQWARDNQVDMDRAYATEEREACTEALGKQLPGLQREIFFVFSPDEWERRKKEFIYEEWVKRADNYERNH